MVFHKIIDWILTERCNLNCYYCLQGHDSRLAECKAINYSFITMTQRPILFHLTGGEPFMLPNLIQLCNHIHSMGHYTSMNTNLTFSPYIFAEKVDSNRFLFINASYHYAYRRQHFSPFIRYYNQFRKAGFFIYATVVMIPEYFDLLSSVVQELTRENIFVLPKLMRGYDNGKHYPKAYTKDQWQAMQTMVKDSISLLSAKEINTFSTACKNNVSIDNWWNIQECERTRCIDGHRYIRITETGDISYCNGETNGNVYLDGLQALLSIEPTECIHRVKNYLCSVNY